MRTTSRRWGTALAVGLLTVMALGRVQAADSEAQPSEQALFRKGAALWPQTCGNCHKARPGGERSPAEWDIITLHMRTLANLPAADSRALQAYLRAH